MRTSDDREGLDAAGYGRGGSISDVEKRLLERVGNGQSGVRNHTKKHMSQHRNTSRPHEPTQSNS